MTDIAILGPKEYLTYEETVYDWQHGTALFRLKIPAGQNTDFASIPSGPVLGSIAKLCGFRHDDPRLMRGSIIHDFLYFCIKKREGLLPDGVYQYFDPDGTWEPVLVTEWKRKDADDLWKKIIKEDGFPPAKAELGYRCLRLFGGIHMKFN